MDIIGLCFPLIKIIIKLSKEAYKSAEDARYTKKTCLLLSDRLEAGSHALSDLYRHREEKDKKGKFKSSNFYDNLQSYVNAATEIKKFIDEISKSNETVKAHSHKVKVKQLVKRYDDAFADLKLGISIDKFKKIGDLEIIMETEFKEMSLSLETIKASLNNQSSVMKLTIDTLASMNSNNNKQQHDIKAIPPGDLKDPEPKEVVKRVKIIKKLLNGIEPVACKLLTDEDYNGEKFNTILAILSKLVLSNNIIRFYGILSSDCGASKIMDNIGEAKIANFFLSKENHKYHRQRIKNIYDEVIPWISPEKLENIGGVNDLKCEIFSFGMFVWELSHQQVPYM
ncbi:3318_t:CDS:2 [Entrophospora sp. SA101]|nr:3318_t:CDS:2 [Entrophospora sp. SA101]